MLPLWMANPGEDFRVEAVKGETGLITAGGRELTVGDLKGCILPVTAKTRDCVYAVFHGHRIAFPREQAMQVRGTVTGKTEVPPEVLTAPSCAGHCAGCSGCK